MEQLIDILTAAWAVLGQMAPYLLFGFLMAGLLSVFISPEWVEKHLGGRGLLPTVKAAVFGIPLPLCSCSVIPVTASIRNHGASRGATTAFLLSAPQTGVDSILATYALLGPIYAVFRPLAALITGVVGGALVSALDEGADQEDGGQAGNGDSCAESCCAGKEARGRFSRALRYGFMTLPGDIAKALLAGIAVAAVITAFVTEGAFAAYLGGGLLAMFAMIAVGIPIYVCSTASIPIAVGFMHMGASPGAALAFLVAGPATNAAAISVVWKVLGRKTAVIYLLTVAIGALAAGFALDFLFAQFGQSGFTMPEHMHEEGAGWLSHLWTVTLLLLLAWGLLRPYLPVSSPQTALPSEDGTLRLKVSGMTCGHCADSVARTLREIEGVSGADVDPVSGFAVLRGDALDGPALVEAVRGLGYDATVETGA